MLRRLWGKLKKESRGPAGDARVPDGLRVYAVGDIHGRVDLLRVLLDEITSDSRKSPADRPLVIFLGDYVDRGPESREVIELLLEGPPAGLEAIYLKGNHEAALLEFLETPDFGREWQRYGGLETLASYGVTGWGSLLDPDFDQARDEFAEALPDSHLEFLQGLELSACLGDYFFVHAGVRPGVPLQKQLPEDLLWIRAEFTRWNRPFEKIVVHGHSITEEAEFASNRIGIDTGAYVTNRLTSVVLEGAERRVLQARGPLETSPTP